MDEKFEGLDFENMTPEELHAFRAQFDPDSMGFDEKEGVEE